MNVLLIDSGTTNSRIRLFNKNENKVIDIEKIRIGVRNTAIEGHNGNLINQLKAGIQRILENNQLVPSDINYIIASGMITSNLGVYEIPHITCPASLEDFVNHSKVSHLKEFFNIPCVFVPGMKNKVSTEVGNAFDSINQFDIMRGEEVETFGLLKQIDVQGKGIMLLPGSHTKFVVVDENKTLTSCLSTLCGEILLAMQKETILSDALSQDLINCIDEKMLEQGFTASKQFGLTRSFYHIRLLQLFSSLDANQRANYFVGSVIYEDIQALLKSIDRFEKMEWIIVGGTNPLRKVFTHLLKCLDYDWKIIEATNEQVEYSLVYGAQEIGSRSIRTFT